MSKTSLQIDRERNIWFMSTAGLQYNVFPDALVIASDALASNPSREALKAVLTERCIFATSRSGKTYTVRGPGSGLLPKDSRVTRRRHEAGATDVHAGVVVQVLSDVIWHAFVSPRWQELERNGRLMAESPAPRKNRGTDSYRPVPVRHGGLI